MSNTNSKLVEVVLPATKSSPPVVVCMASVKLKFAEDELDAATQKACPGAMYVAEDELL